MSKNVVLWTGAGQIGMAIARRIGYGKKIIIGDKSATNAEAIGKVMTDAGFDCEWMEADLSCRDSIKAFVTKCPAGRPGTADEVGALAELVMGPQGAFITGSDFLIDGGATASYYYGPLQPEEN